MVNTTNQCINPNESLVDLYRARNTCKEMARDHVGRRPRTIRSDYIMNTSTLTFQDHYEMWLHENKQDSEIWTYEKWINDYCFKDFRRK